MCYGSLETRYDEDNFLLNTITLPVEAEILQASPQKPFLSAAIKINSALVSQIIMAMEQQNQPSLLAEDGPDLQGTNQKNRHRFSLDEPDERLSNAFASTIG